jgi:hypothetical protein
MEILNKNKADFVRDILPCDGVIVEDEDLYVPVHAVGDHGEASLRAVGLLLPANPLKISYVHFMSSLHALRDGVEKPRSVPKPQTPHNIDCFLGSLFYTRTVFHLDCLTAQVSYEGRAAVEGGK